jgi:methionyl-tRNA synthetase
MLRFASNKAKPTLITTPIFYINSKPHIGHIYTMVYSNYLKDLFKSDPENQNPVYLSTGIDEHGLKVYQSAVQTGHETTQAYADEMSDLFQRTVDELEIDYDVFQRTTDDQHKSNVTASWSKFREKGWIESGEFKGFYDVREEEFVTDRDYLSKT